MGLEYTKPRFNVVVSVGIQSQTIGDGTFADRSCRRSIENIAKLRIGLTFYVDKEKKWQSIGDHLLEQEAQHLPKQQMKQEMLVHELTALYHFWIWLLRVTLTIT